jgi:meso-butanediol dehydrogenase / (S,S)-butanediol dehydrogenase / diacetyl reductase
LLPLTVRFRPIGIGFAARNFPNRPALGRHDLEPDARNRATAPDDQEMKMQRFDGKVAFVTGAAAGIGRATAVRLASEGASLYLVDVAAAGLEETAKLCEAEGASVVAARCDVTSEEDIRSNVAACIERFGRLDTLCNIAGILLLDHFANITADQFRRVLEVNLVGTFMLSQAALPHLIESKGSIVNTSSTSALAGMPYGSAYGTSKGGVSAFTRSIAVEFARRGVRCNAVNPGSILTAMAGPGVVPEDADQRLLARAMPLDKPRGPEVVAAAIAMLASEDGAHINGEEIRVDGGTLS